MSRVVGWVRRHPWRIGSGVVLAIAVLIFALTYFAPQDLLLDTSVNEPLPTATGSPPRQHADHSHQPVRQRPVILRRGEFRSGEHPTSGTALLLRLADGRTFVRLENLSTSNGPAVRVWLSSAAASSTNAAVGAAGHLDLGGLEANHGNQNYVAARARLARYRSVVLWCARFHVVFGSAPLAG
jgi:hypothetical protein